MYYAGTADVQLESVLVPVSIDEDTYREHTWDAVKTAKYGNINIGVAALADANSSSTIIGNTDAKLTAETVKSVFDQLSGLGYSANQTGTALSIIQNTFYLKFLGYMEDYELHVVGGSVYEKMLRGEVQ